MVMPVIAASPRYRSIEIMLTRAGVIELLGQWEGARSSHGRLTPWQHAWQCGQLARRAGANPVLQLASWLHDLGHAVLKAGRPITADLASLDHAEVAARLLEPVFGAAVTQPIALHVQAKRYLVAIRPAYRQGLSAVSQASLAAQGGPMDADEQRRFIAQPAADEALRLRAWDDAAQMPSWHPTDPRLAMHELDVLMEQVLGG
jgi:predicted HD phosphohydrolase